MSDYRNLLGDLLKKLREHLDAGKPARSLIKDAEERRLLQELHLITLKPLTVASVLWAKRIP